MSRRLPSLLVIGALVVGLTGCLEADVKTDLKKDGSGDVSVRVQVSEKMVAMLGELKKLDPESRTLRRLKRIQLVEPEKDVRSSMKSAGCELLDFESTQTDERVSVRYRVAFASLASLAELDRIGPEGSFPRDLPGPGLTLVKNRDGTYTLALPERDDEDGLDDEQGPGAKPGGDAGEDPEAVLARTHARADLTKRMRAESESLSVVVALAVPGKVVSYTPKKFAEVAGRKVTWKVDFKAMSVLPSTGEGWRGKFSVTFRMPEGESIPERALRARK